MVFSAFPSRYTPSTGRPEIAEKSLSFGGGEGWDSLKNDWNQGCEKKKKKNSSELGGTIRRCVKSWWRCYHFLDAHHSFCTLVCPDCHGFPVTTCRFYTYIPLSFAKGKRIWLATLNVPVGCHIECRLNQFQWFIALDVPTAPAWNVWNIQVHLHPRRGNWWMLGGTCSAVSRRFEMNVSCHKNNIGIILVSYGYLHRYLLSKLILFDMRMIHISLCNISIQLLYLQLLACFILHSDGCIVGNYHSTYPMISPFYQQREPSRNVLEKDRPSMPCRSPWLQRVAALHGTMAATCDAFPVVALTVCTTSSMMLVSSYLEIVLYLVCEPEPVVGNSEGIVRWRFLQTQFQEVFWFARFTFWRSCLLPKWFHDTYQSKWFEPVWSIIINI